MISYKNTKVKIYSTDGYTDYFDFVTGVLQGDTLVPYLFIICLDSVLRTSIELMKENGFKLAKERSRRYPAQTIPDTDYADDIALLANTPAQAESLQRCPEQPSGSIGLDVNADKTEYMCLNERDDISTQNGSSLKLVDMFTYLGSSVSSTENDTDTLLVKALAAIDRLSVIWKSDLNNKIKCSFFQAAVAIWIHYMDANNTWRKSLTAITQECCRAI